MHTVLGIGLVSHVGVLVSLFCALAIIGLGVALLRERLRRIFLRLRGVWTFLVRCVSIGHAVTIQGHVLRQLKLLLCRLCSIADVSMRACRCTWQGVQSLLSFCLCLQLAGHALLHLIQTSYKMLRGP